MSDARRTTRPKTSAVLWQIALVVSLVATLGGAWLWSAKNGRRLSRECGELRGRAEAAEREVERLRVAMLAQAEMVEAMARPDATPGDLARVLLGQAASPPAPDA